jgi:hypothetical protein
MLKRASDGDGPGRRSPKRRDGARLERADAADWTSGIESSVAQAATRRQGLPGLKQEWIARRGLA